MTLRFFKRTYYSKDRLQELPLKFLIPEETNLSPKEFDLRYRAKGYPIVLRGAAVEWPAVHKWTFGYFRENYGSYTIQVATKLEFLRVPYLANRDNHREEMTIAALIDSIEQNPDRVYYLLQESIKNMDSLAKDLWFDEIESDYSKQICPGISKLWIGSRGTISGLHADFQDNFIVQVVGTKDIILCSPEHTQFLYPLKDNPSKSLIDPKRIDHRQFPLTRHAIFFEATLHPGDIVYVPMMWWHWLESLKPTISVNYWHGHWENIIPAMTIILRDCSLSHYVRTIRNFLVHGILNQPAPRLFSPLSLGKLYYDAVRHEIRQRFQKPN